MKRRSIQYISESEKDTIHLGAQLAQHLKESDIVCLFGDLGSGKTTFVKGLAQGLDIKRAVVNSPTFVLLNMYEGKYPLYHFDLYRLEKSEEILAIGYEEFLYGDGVAVVEWADKLGPLLPKEYLCIVLTHKTPHERRIKIEGMGKRYRELMETLGQRISQ